MAYNPIKAPSILDRFRDAAAEEMGIRPASRKRPTNPQESKTVLEAERWRTELIKDITRKIAKIHEPGLLESQVRDINDDINKKIGEKAKWEIRIRELGGPDYARRAMLVGLGAEGVTVPGTKGYRYFGRAKDLPGVKELFEAAAIMQTKITPEEIRTRVDVDYFGLRDEDDGLLLKYELIKSREEIEKVLKGASEAAIEELCRDFTVVSNPPSQKEVEDWMVERRRNELVSKYL